MEIKKISILGCGWFGLPLAKTLVAKGYTVNGSTTSANKLSLLASEGIAPFIIDLNQHVDLPYDFFNVDVLIVNVPPRTKTADSTDYAKKLKSIAEAAKGKIRQLIFISSTGVFEDGNFEVDETHQPQPQTAAGEVLLQAENLWANYSQFNTTIIRFGGLIGPGRNLAKFFAGKADIPNGQAPVNLITLDDCIGLCCHLLQTQKFGDTYHGVTPHHPSRAQFYTSLCEVSGMEKPQFKNELLTWKQVDSINIPKRLAYTFEVQNWFEWMKDSTL